MEFKIPEHKRFHTMVKEHGFLPDGDLLDFGEIVVEECIKIVNKLRMEKVKRTGKPVFDPEAKIREYFK